MIHFPSTKTPQKSLKYRGKIYLPHSSVDLVATLHLHEDLEAFQGCHSCPRPALARKRLLSLYSQIEAIMLPKALTRPCVVRCLLSMFQGRRYSRQDTHTPPATPPAIRDLTMLCHERFFDGSFSCPLPPFSLLMLSQLSPTIASALSRP